MHILRRKPLNPSNLPDTLTEGHSQAVLVQGGTRVLMSSQVGIDIEGELAGPELAEGGDVENLLSRIRSLGSASGDGGAEASLSHRAASCHLVDCVRPCRTGMVNCYRG